MSDFSIEAILQRHNGAWSDLQDTQAIMELQAELQGSILLASELQSENADLRRQLEDAEAFSKVNLETHAKWKEAWKIERDSILKREKELEKEESLLAIRLNEQRRELEETKQKSVFNSGIVNIGAHLDLSKDFDAEHNNKTNRLTEEAMKWREQFYDTRRNYEELQAQNAALQSQIEREKDATDSFQREISSLQNAFADQIEESTRNNGCLTSSEGIVNGLKLRLEEKDLLLERLNKEISDLQKARDVAVISKDKMVSFHQTENGKSIHECAKYEAKNRALERKIQATQKDILLATKQAAELEESLRCADKELEDAREELATKKDYYEREAEQCQEDMTRMKHDFTKQLTSVSAMYLEEQAKTKELERRCTEMQENSTKRIADLANDIKRNDNSEELLFAQDHIVKLEERCANLQIEKKEIEHNHHVEIQRLQHACEACHKDLNLISDEKKDIEKNAAAEIAKAAQARKELEDSEHALVKLDEKYQLLIDEKMRLSHKIADLTCQNNCLEKEATLAKARTSNSREKSEGALLDEVEKYKEQLLKEKRRSEAYKGKAIVAHKRSVKAKEVLDSLCHCTR